MNSNEAIRKLEQEARTGMDGLPKELFLFVSRLTPLVCLDLLIKDTDNRTLFTWRDDDIFGQGWHLPGGVVRHGETFASRIGKVAKLELGTTVRFADEPLTFVQDIDASKINRGHFIAFLYGCELTSELDEALRYKQGQGEPKVGQWKWFEGCPDRLLPVHEVYRTYL